MDLKVKKLRPDAKLPQYAKPGDAGLDLTALTVSDTGEYLEYGTGISIEVPEGHIGLIFPRSSISNRDLILTNSVGVIDSGYRGEIKFRFKPVLTVNGNNRFGAVRASHQYNVGERIGQLVIIPYPKMIVLEVPELSQSDRGIDGFGSSGV